MKFRRLIRHVWYITPILVTLGTLLYFSFMYNYYKTSLVNQLYTEKIQTTKKVINELDNINQEYDKLLDAEFKAFLVAFIQSIDAEYAIYARVFDVNGEPLSEPQIADTEEKFVQLRQSSMFDFMEHIHYVKDHPEGDIVVQTENCTELLLHWFSYPKDSSTYYIFVGVIPERVERLLNINSFTYGLLGILVVMLTLTFYNVYLIFSRANLRNRLCNCKERNGEEFNKQDYDGYKMEQDK